MKPAHLLLPLCLALLAGCPDGDPPVTDAGTDAGPGGSCEGAPCQWHVVFDDLEGAVLCAAGADESDVFFAGGGLGNGSNALAIHYDGDVFHRIGTDTTETFWWVWPASPTDVFFVGSAGVIYHWNGTGDATAMASPVTEVLYGVWGAAPDDVWAVGGNPFGTGDVDIILHYDGSDWTRMPLTAGPGVSLFKVWGSGSDDVFVVGQSGTILHWDGSSWSPQTSGARPTLFTTSGTGPNDVFAVGGPPTTLLHYDGSTWTPAAPDGPDFFSNGLNGVSANALGNVMIVGMSGVKWRRDRGAWLSDSEAEPWDDLHGCWLGPNGHGFAVGGGFLVAPASHGVIAYFGPTAPASMLVP